MTEPGQRPGDRSPGSGVPEAAPGTATTEHVLDQYEAERPGRKLEGFPAKLVAVLGAGLALFRSSGSSSRWPRRSTAPRS